MKASTKSRTHSQDGIEFIITSHRYGGKIAFYVTAEDINNRNKLVVTDIYELEEHKDAKSKSKKSI